MQLLLLVQLPSAACIC